MVEILSAAISGINWLIERGRRYLAEREHRYDLLPDSDDEQLLGEPQTLRAPSR